MVRKAADSIRSEQEQKSGSTGTDNNNRGATTTAMLNLPQTVDKKTVHALIAKGAENMTGPWLCLRCGVDDRPLSIPSYKAFRDHLTVKHKESIDSCICEHCGWRAESHNPHLLYHWLVAHNIRTPVKFPTCKECAHEAVTDAALDQHMKEMHKLREHCAYCSKMFETQPDVYNHVKEQHRERALSDGMLDLSKNEDKFPDGRDETEFVEVEVTNLHAENAATVSTENTGITRKLLSEDGTELQPPSSQQKDTNSDNAVTINLVVELSQDLEMCIDVDQEMDSDMGQEMDNDTADDEADMKDLQNLTEREQELHDILIEKEEELRILKANPCTKQNCLSERKRVKQLTKAIVGHKKAILNIYQKIVEVCNPSCELVDPTSFSGMLDNVEVIIKEAIEKAKHSAPTNVPPDPSFTDLLPDPAIFDSLPDSAISDSPPDPATSDSPPDPIFTDSLPVSAFATAQDPSPAPTYIILPVDCKDELERLDNLARSTKFVEDVANLLKTKFDYNTPKKTILLQIFSPNLMSNCIVRKGVGIRLAAYKHCLKMFEIIIARCYNDMHEPIEVTKYVNQFIHTFKKSQTRKKIEKISINIS